MRGRASLLVAAVLLVGATPAVADEKLQPYEATVSRDQAAVVADSGIELDHAGFKATALGTQQLQLAITASQADKLEAKGIDLTAEALPKTAKLATGGDSPNPYYDVFRSYSEAGGIADELRAEAAANKDVAKLVQIGTSLLGKPILALKITNDARNVPRSPCRLLLDCVARGRDRCGLAARDGVAPTTISQSPPPPPRTKLRASRALRVWRDESAARPAVKMLRAKKFSPRFCEGFDASEPVRCAFGVTKAQRAGRDRGATPPRPLQRR